jgi:hypothetical protein
MSERDLPTIREDTDPAEAYERRVAMELNSQRQELRDRAQAIFAVGRVSNQRRT